MRIKSIQRTRLGFNTSKWWVIKFTATTNKYEQLIIQALAADSLAVLPEITQANGVYTLSPVSDKAMQIIDSLAD